MNCYEPVFSLDTAGQCVEHGLTGTTEQTGRLGPSDSTSCFISLYLSFVNFLPVRLISWMSKTVVASEVRLTNSIWQAFGEHFQHFASFGHLVLCILFLINFFAITPIILQIYPFRFPFAISAACASAAPQIWDFEFANSCCGYPPGTFTLWTSQSNAKIGLACLLNANLLNWFSFSLKLPA